MSIEMISREENNLQAERLTIIENRIFDNMNRVVEGLLDIGRCLNQVKDEGIAPHGEWEAWVENRLGMNLRTAQRYMKAAREVSSNSRLSQLAFTKIEALLALPAEEREAFAEEVDAENKSVRELRAAIKAKEAAEKALEKERARREQAEADLLNQTEQDGNAQAEIDRLQAEIDDQEAEIERRAEAEAAAKRELLALRTQVARGYISNSSAENLTPEELGEITASFIGRAAVLPHMRAHFATCDHNTRGAYKAHVEMLADWCERAMRALDTIEGEVLEV